MVHPLYYVLDLIFVLLLLLILHHDFQLKQQLSKSVRTYRLLVYWVIIFSIQDAVWGFVASDAVQSDLPLFISSAVFHLSTVLTTFFWLYYMLTYLGNRLRYGRLLLILDVVVILIQVSLVIANFFTPVIFSVVNGQYVTEAFRPLAFFNQYVVYLTIGIITLIRALYDTTANREKYLSVFIFSLAPILSGVFQLLYPDGPFYAMGYFLGCFIIHMYVIGKERDELNLLHAERQLHEQRMISNTDGMTGLWNRRFYDSDVEKYMAVHKDDDFSYISIDINGLKNVNDTLGHEAGDELIIGAAECLKQVFGPYGRIYRIGGDEFVVVAFVSERDMKRITDELDETVSRWRGSRPDMTLSLSYGFVSRQEFTRPSFKAMTRMADERMYSAKEAHYSRMGIDRRGLQAAYSALCASYTKILKINLTDDTYTIITMDKSDQTSEKGFSDKISVWLHDFGTSGQVHPDDLDVYLSLTDTNHINEYFSKGGKNYNIIYRRKQKDGYRKVKMEMVASEDYSFEKISLYLYVKDIDV